MGGPAGMPADVVTRLSEALRASLSQPRLAQQFKTLGLEANLLPPDKTQQFYLEELGRWDARVRSEGLQAEN